MTEATATDHCGTRFVPKTSPLIEHRSFARYDHTHNARFDGELDEQRWTAETAFSAIKRRYSTAVGPSDRYREFREPLLTAAVYTLEQAIEAESRRPPWIRRGS